MFPNKKIQISDGWKLKHAFSRYLQKISFEAKTRLVLWELLGFSKKKTILLYIRLHLCDI